MTALFAQFCTLASLAVSPQARDTVLEGNFEVQAAYADNSGISLSLVAVGEDGRDDPRNWVSISLSEEDGVPVARVHNRVDGRADVFTPGTQKQNAMRSVALDNAYSVPFTSADRRLKILRNDVSGYFHLYAGVRKEIAGRNVQGWVELTPTEDMNPAGTRFRAVANGGFVPVRAPARGDCEITRAERFPAHDTAIQNGFTVEKRLFSWSGFRDTAYVVSFDPAHSPARNGERFVFWRAANYIPCWRLSDETMFSYEFVETWSKEIEGCFEPMSDRLLRFSRVGVVEDNAVRKILRWDYALVNPDYLPPSSEGSDYPMVTEFYTFYPDASAIRTIHYYPKLDSPHRERHELGELIVISGCGGDPADVIESPGLRIGNLAGDRYELHPARGFDADEVGRWPEIIFSARLKLPVEPFCVFSYREGRPVTAPLRVSPEFTWHHTRYRMSHWPASAIPYASAHKSTAGALKLVSHTSLAGMTASGGTGWRDRYLTTPDGRRYRQYLSLIGLARRNKDAAIADHAGSWLDPARVSVSGEAAYQGYDFARGEYAFTLGVGNALVFRLDASSSAAVRPVFRIADRGGTIASIRADGRKLKPEKDFLQAAADDGLLIYLNGAYTDHTEFEIVVND